MTRMTGKQAFMEMLRAQDVKYIFGNPGTSESAIMASLPSYPEIEYVLTTQEGVAMGMADGYANATGQPSFVNLHIETGMANGISLLHHAMDGGTPLVLTSGNKDVRKLTEGRTDLTEMVRQFTKWSVEITHPEQVPGVLRRAFNEANTPPTGPVYVAISANALEDEADVEILSATSRHYRTAADAEAVRAAAGLLANADNPVILVGDRLAQSGGTNVAVRLAELLGARVYTTSYARMNFPSGHPQFLGRINLALPAWREALSSSDALLAVGADVFSGFFYLPGRVLGDKTKLIHVDSAHRAVGRSEPTDVGIIADPKSALEDIYDATEQNMSGVNLEAARSRVESVAQQRDEWIAAWQGRLKERWDLRPMAAERMMSEAAGALPDDIIIVDDSLSSKDALHGAFRFNEPESIFGERVGAIGWGMGSTMGVKLAYPNRPVVGVVGDGSAMMTVQALWTAAVANIPVVYLICNNRSYRILKLNMNIYKNQILKEESPERYVGMDFPIPLNIAGIANAIGVYGRTIEDPTEIGPALRQALDSGKPAVLDVVIDGSL